MRVSGDQQERVKQPDPIEFVPKQELDRAEQQIKKQQREIERLQQENGRLRKEMEAALRASKRQARRIPVENQRPTRNGPAANPAVTTVSNPAALSRRASMNRLESHYRSNVRTVEVG